MHYLYKFFLYFVEVEMKFVKETDHYGAFKI